VNEEHEGGAGRNGDQTDHFSSEETVGEILLQARERAQSSLEEVSQETRLSIKNIEYLETDNFEALPAKVYVRGFIRTYAAFLGLDVEYMLSKYEVQSGQTHKTRGDLWEIETEVVEEKMGSGFPFRRLLLPIIIVVLALIVVVFIMRRGGQGGGEPGVPPANEEPAEIDTVVARTPVQEEERIEEVPTPQVPLEPMTLRLTANPSDSTWFELITVSTVDKRPETTTFNFLLLPGRSRTFEATEAFVLKQVSNAGGFTIELDGHRLRPLGRKGRPANDIQITRDDIPR
jgi:cytoskeletal protein RodZ